MNINCFSMMMIKIYILVIILPLISKTILYLIAELILQEKEFNVLNVLMDILFKIHMINALIFNYLIV